ncbi:RNA-guided endonuclease InsQ/TnpB family protein [Microseira sp. BLCC-F43]|uniref:RNA-guided endonuclease InsQ/TnpB family protein n=1 Tax=Microseira sp. BLCC-F43 TaxID=3153602 RepID=UPI0035B93DC2
MKLNYQYRIYPFTAQIEKMNKWLRICRYLYNRWLGQCLDWWDRNRCPINACPLICHLPELADNPYLTDLKAQLPELKKDLVTVKWSGELLDLSGVYSTVLQDVYTSRLKKAMEWYIKGDSKGFRSGRPRYKTEADYRSFKFPQAKNEWIDPVNCVLKLPFIGGVQIRLHRPLPPGFKLKTVQAIKKADGWYANLCVEDSTVPEFIPDDLAPNWDNSLGIDAVLFGDDYLATSDGDKIASLKSFRKYGNKLAQVSKRRSARKKASNRRRKLAKREACIHQRIARSRKDHAFKTAHKLVKTGKKVFFHEDLELRNLTKRNKAKQDESGKFLTNGQSAKSGLNKSWLDAAFGQGFQTLEYIAAKAGARVLPVVPACTSQYLSYRDESVFTDCSIREYWDEVENIWVDRDINAAVNIKRVGLGLFLTLNSRSGKIKVSHTDSTAMEVLRFFRELQKPALDSSRKRR